MKKKKVSEKDNYRLLHKVVILAWPYFVFTNECKLLSNLKYAKRGGKS